MIERILIALGMVAAATASVQAEETFMDDRWYIAPVAQYSYTGRSPNVLEQAWGAGLGIGRIINEYFNVEVRPLWNHYHGNRGDGRDLSLDMYGGVVDVQYYLMRGAFQPYTVVAAGASTWGPNGDLRSTRFLGEAGLGANYELSDNFLLRGDLRYRANVLADDIGPNDQHGLVLNVGFMVPFGEKPRAPLAAAPAPVVLQDACETRDSDGDGVNDCLDKCPGTMKGAKVDSDGCLIRIELRGVNFKFDSAELTDSAKRILDETAENLIVFPEKRDIEVAGHTSTEGTNEYNMRLSIRRAQAVADYLKAKGVTNPLYPKGYGEEYPLVPEYTEADREKNRRVELIWMGD